MRTLLFIAVLLSTAVVDIKIEAAATSALENNRIELFVNNNLLKLYTRKANATEVSVPQKNGYALQQVAVIEETEKTRKANFEYVAVYRQQKSDKLMVVLYDLKNKEQLAIDNVKSVAFDSNTQHSRILLERTGPNGQTEPEALLVPGRIQVAHKG